MYIDWSNPYFFPDIMLDENLPEKSFLALFLKSQAPRLATIKRLDKVSYLNSSEASDELASLIQAYYIAIDAAYLKLYKQDLIKTKLKERQNCINLYS